jgi:hypothetical protein
MLEGRPLCRPIILGRDGARPSNFLDEGMTGACRMRGASLILVQRRRHPYSFPSE